ncbi:hypothetical protein L210DRAFT_2971433 [Boletus edulis BED1]|uniref:DUF6533 domain-containing protein n=1 Tax=Boletus edulis BED1 TaxID=1328754 RepID=A0AAD4GJU0_BOLED|nr:hypothetical protein L210DRAFT_2971433 [Boletus edulis BED1]
MSSDIQSTLELLVLNNYLSLAIVTAVIYDYILTFSREIEYIWTLDLGFHDVCYRPLHRSLLDYDHYTLSFLPGPLEVSTVIYQIAVWTYIPFLSAIDLMMILRVYAMWNRSRTILSTLLFLLVTQTIVTVVLNGIYNNPNTHVSVTMGQVLDFSFCISSFINTPVTLPVYRAVPQLVLSAALVILAVSQTLKQSFEMYKATKQWQPNRYMQKLVRDGILYFFVNVLYQIDYVLAYTVLSNITVFFLSAFIYVAFYTLIPRFIISIRELYDHDIRGRFHIDTGFGLRSRSNPGLDTTVSAMVFVGGDQGPEVEGGTDNSGDLELGTVHGSGLNEGSHIGARE